VTASVLYEPRCCNVFAKSGRDERGFQRRVDLVIRVQIIGRSVYEFLAIRC
jgi:hypothetical protein